MTHLKNFARILLLTLVSTPLSLTAYIVVPVVLLLVPKEADRLPSWLRWYDDHKYGINGDEYWQGPEHANGHEREYLWRLKWLTRNKMTTFAHEVLGVKVDKNAVVKHWGDIRTANRPIGHSGWQYIELHQNGKMYPCYYVVYQWGNTGRCFRMYAGWKLKDYAEYGAEQGSVGKPYAMFKSFIPNPLMGFAKKD